MKYRHIIWDFDGTLFDSYPVMARAFEAALAEIGIHEDVESIVSHMKISMRRAFEHYTTKYGIGDGFFERYKALNKAQDEDMKPFAGAIDICRAVCDNGGKNYLFTHRGGTAVEFIENFGMCRYFTDYVTKETGLPSKPDPSALLYLMDKHIFSAAEALMVGDRGIDIMSAKNACMSACFFDEAGELCAEADYNIKSLLELFLIIL